MYVRCPIDKEDIYNPRVFATGKVKSINYFNESAHVVFSDPLDQRKYFDNIPYEVEEIPMNVLYHCNICKGMIVKYGNGKARIVEYMKDEDDYYVYYLKDLKTKQCRCVREQDIIASFLSGGANPIYQLKTYEFQNPCWYFGRQVVKETMNVLDNSIMGFKELAGCKIFLKAFQLNTIIQCLQDDYCRYMLADEVGLGKTIEACSVLKIYLSDKSNKNVLITVPKTLVGQWRTELLFKFGLIEGRNDNNNFIYLSSVEELTEQYLDMEWDFIIVDEVHNYLKNELLYDSIHTLSKKSKNVILLSATPIQQRKDEYLNLLRLILPEKYDDLSMEMFSKLVEKQNKISRLTYSLLDELDSFRNELLPEIESDNPHEDEDVIEELEAITDYLDDLSNLIGDKKLNEMVQNVDMSKDDFGAYDIQVIISYICDYFQIERNIIRGRRAILGVYPKDSEGEFAERKLSDISYAIDEEENFYEYDAYMQLKSWIMSMDEKLTEDFIKNIVQPILESFFSSPWAYVNSLNEKSKIIKISENVIKSAQRWLEDEDEAIENIANILDDVNSHPSRLIKLISYIDENLFGEKIVLFTDHIETFEKYYEVLYDAFGEEVTGFSKSIDRDEAEINIYRFQSDPDCKILICDSSGGEGRNLQIADYIVHIDLPWNINTIEQRIGRLDRMGRNIEIPVTSIVIHSINSYEEQLYKFWNEGLNVFTQSLSGLEIIMSDVNNKIIDAIKSDFEFGLYRLIPELIEEANKMRETVHREQIFDTAAIRFKPLYIQLEKLLMNYEFNENDLFAKTMMSWASLTGFGKIKYGSDDSLVVFDEDNFSIKSAQNSFLIPPDWKNYMSKKQNEIIIKAQRGLAKEKEKNVSHNNQKIIGTFDRDYSIKNDYIHFYAPGDEIFDCIVENSVRSYKGMCSAFAAESEIDWKGFVYSYSIEPNERYLLDNGIPLYKLGMLRQYLASSIQIIPVGFTVYENVPLKTVLSEYKRIINMGHYDRNTKTDHLGRRGYGKGILRIPERYSMSNLEWFKKQFPPEKWEELVEKSSQYARKRARENFQKESNLSGAKEMISQILSMEESHTNYFGIDNKDFIEDLKKQYEIIYESLKKPIIRIESACFVWLMKNEK